MSGGDVRKAVSGFDAPAVEDRLDALLKAYGALLRGAIRRVCPATFGISNGLAAGFVSYAGMKLAAGRWREGNPLVYAIALLFVWRYSAFG